MERATAKEGRRTENQTPADGRPPCPPPIGTPGDGERTMTNAVSKADARTAESTEGAPVLSNYLTMLAVEVGGEVAAYQRSSRAAHRAYLRAGEMLLRARRATRHGQWAAFLAELLAGAGVERGRAVSVVLSNRSGRRRARGSGATESDGHRRAMRKPAARRGSTFVIVWCGRKAIAPSAGICCRATWPGCTSTTTGPLRMAAHQSPTTCRPRTQSAISCWALGASIPRVIRHERAGTSLDALQGKAPRRAAAVHARGLSGPRRGPGGSSEAVRARGVARGGGGDRHRLRGRTRPRLGGVGPRTRSPSATRAMRGRAGANRAPATGAPERPVTRTTESPTP